MNHCSQISLIIRSGSSITFSHGNHKFPINFWFSSTEFNWLSFWILNSALEHAFLIPLIKKFSLSQAAKSGKLFYDSPPRQINWQKKSFFNWWQFAENVIKILFIATRENKNCLCEVIFVTQLTLYIFFLDKLPTDCNCEESVKKCQP
jgi:hypothetical protein